MKRKSFILLSIVLILFFLAGCNESGENKPEKTAEIFLTEIYTVDLKEIENYNSFSDLQTTDIQGLIEAIELNDEEIKSLMTEKAYNVLVMSRQNLMFTMYSAMNDYTIEVTDIVLTQSAKEENEADYNFEVNLKFVSTKDSSLDKTDIGKGNLRLIKENEEWKVSNYRTIEFPKYIVPAGESARPEE
ncbi:MAG: hypothetical protein AB7V48_17515 [Sedimentibacter sp.]